MKIIFVSILFVSLHAQAMSLDELIRLLSQVRSNHVQQQKPSFVDDHTPLMHAVAQGNAGQVRKLSAHEKDVNATNARGQTALHLATIYASQTKTGSDKKGTNYTKIVQSLLHAKGDPTIKAPHYFAAHDQDSFMHESAARIDHDCLDIALAGKNKQLINILNDTMASKDDPSNSKDYRSDSD